MGPFFFFSQKIFHACYEKPSVCVRPDSRYIGPRAILYVALDCAYIGIILHALNASHLHGEMGGGVIKNGAKNEREK